MHRHLHLHLPETKPEIIVLGTGIGTVSPGLKEKFFLHEYRGMVDDISEGQQGLKLPGGIVWTFL